MGFHFRKNIKIAPGTRLNIDKHGVGVSAEEKESRVSAGSSVTRLTPSVPGIGTSFQQRLSYRITKKAGQKNNAITKQQKVEKRLAAVEQNQLEVALFHNKIDMLRILHTECREQINWQEVLNEQHPFRGSNTGPNELEAIKALESYKPIWKDKLFGRIEERKKQLLDLAEKAKEDDLQLVKLWEEKKELANKILSGEVSAYEKVLLDESSFDDIFELGVEINCCILSPSTLVFEVDIKSEEAVPTSLLLAKTGNPSAKNVPKKVYHDMHQDYVCSIAMRIGRDGFNLLPINNIYVHINDILENSLELGTVLSVKFERMHFDNIDFNHCDCSDEIEKFQHHMNYKKAKGLQLVDKLIEEI